MRDRSDYELVMPFILCESNGGDLDDRAFAAGWRCAEVNAGAARLEAGQTDVWVVPDDEVDQIDLIAMSQGCVMVTAPNGEDTGWTLVRLTKTAGLERVTV